CAGADNLFAPAASNVAGNLRAIGPDARGSAVRFLCCPNSRASITQAQVRYDFANENGTAIKSDFSSAARAGVSAARRAAAHQSGGRSADALPDYHSARQRRAGEPGASPPPARPAAAYPTGRRTAGAQTTTPPAERPARHHGPRDG